jgi:hypothetical protein
MGTTTAYALRYADSTSNVQLWTHFQNLATDVDTTLTTKYGVVARWSRITSRTSVGGVEAPVIRIDNIPLLGGIYYTVETNSIDANVEADGTAVIYTRLSTAGAATTASAFIGYAQFNCSAVAARQGPAVVAEYAPVGNVTASVLLSVGRTGGTGTVTLSAAAAQPIILMVRAWGKAVTPSGVDL